jgi:hypothetical protein
MTRIPAFIAFRWLFPGLSWLVALRRHPQGKEELQRVRQTGRLWTSASSCSHVLSRADGKSQGYLPTERYNGWGSGRVPCFYLFVDDFSV